MTKTSQVKPQNGFDDKLPVWNLDDIYPGVNSPELQADIEKLDNLISDFSKTYKDRLVKSVVGADDFQLLATAIKQYEEIVTIKTNITGYAHLMHSVNSDDAGIGKFLGDITAKNSIWSSDLSFFAIEINNFDQSVIDQAIENDADVKHYKSWLNNVRAFKPYQLSEDLERLFAEKEQTATDAWQRFFNEKNGKLRVKFDGKKLNLTSAFKLAYYGDEQTREKAARAIAKVYKRNESTFAYIINVLINDKIIEDKWRGFKTPQSSRNLSNQVEDEVVDALDQAVVASYPRLSHRYYRLKAKWLGKEKLEYWDRVAPLPAADDRYIPWDKAKDIVLTSMDSFSPRFADIGQRFFDGNWIHAPTIDGKQSGAFCAGITPAVHPYIMVNYEGRLRDVMTLAHELGHGIHDVLAYERGTLTYHPSLTIAETASVFCEMLTFKALLEQAETRQQRRQLLAEKIEDMLNTVVSQICFYNFEKIIHNQRRQGELSIADINKAWMETRQDSLGPAFNLSSDYALYWSHVTHFFMYPFYVYAYAFGCCLVNSLYGLYQQDYDGFGDKYTGFLSAGGTKHHSELLAPFGFNAGDPEFWRIGLDFISTMIDEVEELED